MVILTHAYFYYHLELFHLKTFKMKNPKKSFLKRLKKHSELMHKKEFVEPVYFYQKSYDSLIVKFHKKQTYTDIELFLKEAMIDIEEVIKKIS